MNNLTLEEAIAHAEEVADYDCYNDDQRTCANEHRQLAKWLKELKSLKENKTGHWIDIDTWAYTWKVKCSNCGHERSMMSTQGIYPNFCEHCGANMREENYE